jgi:hypothetical protein
MATTTFNSRVQPRSGKRQRLAVSSAVVQFTEANYKIELATAAPRKIASAAMVQVVGADQIYYTLDGSTPSSTVGFVADPGDTIFLPTYQQLKEFKAIRVAADSSVEALFLFE